MGRQRWKNWAGDQSCTPLTIARPGSLAELRDVVGRAVASDGGVRVSASGHSFTDIALTEGTMIRLDRMTRRLGFDASTGRFKVEGGVVLSELNRLLDSHGVAFENLGDIDRQTLAGSISTATHGTGARFRNISAQVAALELVTADGRVMEVSSAAIPTCCAPPGWASAALGVIYSVTLRAVPAFTMRPRRPPAAARPRPSTASTSWPAAATTSSSSSSRTRRRPSAGIEPTGPMPSPRPAPAVVYAHEILLEN